MSAIDTRPLPFQYQFLSGAIAGISEILVMYPLDVVKTRIQLQVTGATGPNAYTSMVDCFSKIIRNEGFNTLYRGITAPILMEAPKRATKFAANDLWGTFLKDTFGSPVMTQPLAIGAGFLAGVTEAFIITPFELIKIRLQDKSSKGKYSGMNDAVRKVIKSEGISTLYSGFESTLFRQSFWNVGYFGVIFQVKSFLPNAETKGSQIRNDLIAGSIGGFCGTALNTPFDVVKTRIQSIPKIENVVPKYNWAFTSILTVAREEGASALYKGFLPKVLRLGPGGGIMLVVFTTCSDFFKGIHYGD
ncbi:mitochondrial carrier [Nadsonia fulvescens var. elongata DSM 6958]|uniref:Mitochondrial carrier n=1 Tax=Nadsonia fulvescens var. elongata DSM 6958 TaxID=857566 RepID=A0A1E3PT75_9ASCO|nr:mitochondrial carrier [Nadsonia fulvescens var. elongata DSM 6958]